MKKIKKIFLTIAVVTMAVLCFTFGASALEETGQCGENVYWKYNVDTDELIISGTGPMYDYDYETSPFYTSDIRTAVIYDNVTSIGDCAFSYCHDITNIIVSNSVTSIGDNAFYSCGDLESVTLGNSVTSIGDYAFFECKKLKNITIPDSVTSIGSDAFSFCHNLTSVVIPDSVTTISSSVFYDCYRLTSITIPDSVTFIGESAFYHCDSLTSVSIPDSVTSIRDDAFYDCDNLTSVTIGNSVTSIGERAFYHCDRLTSVIIPDSVTSIGDSAFCDCDSLTNLKLSNSATSIGNYAFYSCNSLLIVALGNSVTSIGNYAFSNCDNLVNITIPDSVTFIGDSAFRDCYNLISVTIGNSVPYIKDYVFGDCNNLTSIIFALDDKNQSKITYMPDISDTKVKEIVLPASISHIGYDVFPNSIEKVTVYNPECEISFSDGLDDTLTIVGFKDSKAERFAVLIGAEFIDIETVHTHSYKAVKEIGYCSFARCVCGKTTSTDHIDQDNNTICETCQNTTNDIEIDKKITLSLRSHEDVYLKFTAPVSGRYTINAASDDFTDTKVGVAYPNKEIIDYNIDYIVDNTITYYLNQGTTVYWYFKGSNYSYIGEVELTLTCEKEEHKHSYSSKTTKSATCTSTGVKTYTCSCGDSYTKTIAKKAHTIVTVKGKPATCKATGLTNGKKCSVCGTVTVKQTTIAKTGHTIVTVKGKSATCKATGLTNGKKCSVCGTVTVKQTTIAKTGHTIVTVKGKPATCKATGLTDGKKCSVCGTVTVKQTTIANTGHTYTTTTTKATLTKNGQAVKKCSVCGAVSSTTTIYYPKTIKFSVTSYTYNGKTKTPTVTVKDSKGNALKKDTDYTVKYESGRKLPGKYTVTVTFKGKYSGTKILAFSITPKVISKVSATQTTTSVTLNWSKVTGATGYRVFQKVNGKWKTLTNTTKLTYTIKRLKAGTNYTFAVRPYTVDGKSTVLASTYTQLNTATKCKTPTLKITSTKKGVAAASWTNVAGETGYELYGSSKKSSGFKSIATTKANVVKASKKKLTSKKTYYFKVRAYKTVDGVKVYSDWSAVKSVKIK